MNRLVTIFLLSFLVGMSLSAPVRGARTLVLLDDLAMQDSYSIFFQSLRQRGFELVFGQPSSPSASIIDTFGSFPYDKLIIFAPTADFNQHLSSHIISSFIDSGKDVLIATNSDSSSNIAKIASSVGIRLPAKGERLIDHINFDESDATGDHTLVVADKFTNNAFTAFQVKSLSPVLYEGTGFNLDSNNELVFPILKSSPSSYVHSAEDAVKQLNAAGQNTVLIAGLQARNNARVVFSGSLSLFSNRLIQQKVHRNKESKNSGNAELITLLSKWVFQEMSVLKVENIHHYNNDDKKPTDLYTIRDSVHYALDIHEWNGAQWVPYNADDVQLEFQMLDPYLRLFIPHDQKGHFSLDFQAPDVYGVFTFKLEYHKVGFTFLEDSKVVTVRPLRHNQYERFIISAYPYYAATFSMMAATAFFSFFFLFGRKH